MSPSSEKTISTRRKLGAILSSESSIQDKEYHDDFTDYLLPSGRRNSTDTSSSYPSTPNSYNTTNSSPTSVTSSPYNSSMSPWTEPSPYRKSPWIHNLPNPENLNSSKHGLIGSILREEGHIYSLVSSGDLLYTGSESKNVRVWKGLDDFSGFKSSSGLVKAIVVSGEKVFTGHQDGKIRVWRFLKGKRNVFRRVGNLPTTRDLLMKSVNPRNYVRVRRNRNVPWVKHYDAVSCMCIDINQGLLYSGSWDKTLKVWRISDYKCLESIHAHKDALNSVTIGFDGFLFTGSADGTVKAWRRELVGRYTKHVLVETLLEQDHAITSLAVNHEAGAVYAGSSDGLVNFWEREKHFMTYGGVLRGHKLAVLCLTVAGNLVVSGSADKSICVWRRDLDGMHVCTTVLTGHMGPVKCLTVAKEDEENSNGNDNEEDDDQRWILYSGSLDKSVKVWRVTESRITDNGDGREGL